MVNSEKSEENLSTSQNLAKKDQLFFNIKEVSQIIGVVPATIRNWEKQGLFIAKRKENNYRVYDFQDIEILKTIKNYSSDKNIKTSVFKQFMGHDNLYYSYPQKENTVYSKEFYHSKFKKYREEKQYTLEEVSKHIGISPSYLSRIEQGSANASFEIIDKLANFYGESIILFFDLKNDSPSEVVRKGKANILDVGLDGVKVELLTNNEQVSMETAKFIIDETCGDFKSHKHNTGTEFIYVLSGKLQVELDNEKVYVLNTGDSITFKSERYHKWFNPGKKQTQIIWSHSYL